RWAVGPIEIDGKADEAAWQGAELIDKFGLPWLKENARPAKTATKAKLLWDRENLYFFADLEDHDLYADLLQHDDRTWLNDVFELFFRPDENKPPYYEFQVNAAGTMLDIFFQRKGIGFEQAKIDGEFHWKAAVVRRGTLDNRTDRDEGWSVEGRIPWDDFARTGGRPAVGDVWRFALCRYDYTLNEKPETSTAAPLSQPSFHLLEDYARLKFVGMKTGGVGRPTPNGRLDARPGIPTRAFVTTSKVVGSPDPPLPYRPVRAFPNLKLTFPISLDWIPGSDQLLVIAQEKSYGPATILRIADDPNVEKAEQVLVIPAGGTAYGICFHPRFAENGYLYVGWNGAVGGGSKRTYATRYTMDRATLALDPKSALDIISWESNGHNGGDLEFGLDGMLYITSGDGTSDSDTNLRGQDLTQLTSKVLRIDVDHPAEGKNYGVPADNPFVGQEGVVPETWAYGLRNPWRLTVDPKTGHLWVGNNGQDLWEQVYFVHKGDNFGWSVYEGSHIFYANRTMGPQPLTLPAAEHHHSEARSMTGGVVYHGSKLPELAGAYIYGDHSTGRIWGIRHDGMKVTWHKLLVDTTFNITGFGIDRHGELLVADHRGDGQGGYYYLEPSPPQSGPSIFPKKLSESGLFANVKGHEMQPGVIPYSVNSPLWSDGSYKERYFAVPEH
ncbi:MAG TPA: PQQ-dependent sugar dehydrogenase, partial [Pirellulaceae bacterium]|nr:PQQ-dependent sugar dehydrogenase [Pirellulaceae bacterium]